MGWAGLFDCGGFFFFFFLNNKGRVGLPGCFLWVRLIWTGGDVLSI